MIWSVIGITALAGMGGTEVIITNSRSPRSTPISIVVEHAKILRQWSLKSSCTCLPTILSTCAVCSACTKSAGNR